MNKHKIRLIIAVSVFSLLILVGLQVRWVVNGFNLTREQFDHRATLAINEVIEEVSKSSEIYRGCTNASCANYSEHSATIEHVINYRILDSLMAVKFTNYRLGSDYRYKLFNADERDCPSLATFSNKIYMRPHDNCTTWMAKNYQIGVFFPGKKRQVIAEMSLWVLVSSLVIVFIGGAISFIVRNVLQQKKLTEIKNDFINNMTHEFKTPLSTISLATDVLQKCDPAVSSDRIKRYSAIISEENNRMKMQVDYILKMALLQRKELKLKLGVVNVHQLIQQVIDNLCIDQYKKKVDIVFSPKASDPHVFIDEMHFTNIVLNLISNAAKYSHDPAEIHISTLDLAGGIGLVFEDNGIGISPQDQKFIFDKFYRVSSGDLHDVKGFGLGLYYVKEMVKAHQGQILVRSEPGKGSRFSIFIPYINKN